MAPYKIIDVFTENDHRSLIYLVTKYMGHPKSIRTDFVKNSN